MSDMDDRPPRFDASDDEIRAFAERYRVREPNAPCHAVGLAASWESNAQYFARVHWSRPGQPVERWSVEPQ
jgi:hypothetical protein